MAGLKAPLEILRDTMMPDISPDTLAESAVQVDGGYDPCHFNVSNYCGMAYQVYKSTN